MSNTSAEQQPEPVDNFELVFAKLESDADVHGLNELDLELELAATELNEINELRRLSLEIASKKQPLYTCT